MTKLNHAFNSALLISTMLLSQSGFAGSQSELTEEYLKRVQSQADTLNLGIISSITSEKLASDYAYEPLESCYAEKLKPLEQLPDERQKRKAFDVRLECKLKHLKAEQKYLKQADIDAQEKIRKIFTPRADEISPDDARTAVIEAFNTIPKSKVGTVKMSLFMALNSVYNGRNEKDYAVRQHLQRNQYKLTPEVFLSAGKPEDSYRSLKIIILQSNQVWDFSTTLSL